MKYRGEWRFWLGATAAAFVVLILVAGGAGYWLLGILGVWAAIFGGGWLISKRIGGRPHYLGSWPFEDGEAVVWRDDRADVYVLTMMDRPAVVRPLRLHRAQVLVTTHRILVAMSELFTGRQRVVYVLYEGTAPLGENTSTFGGVLKTGYQTLIASQLSDGYLLTGRKLSDLVAIQ